MVELDNNVNDEGTWILLAPYRFETRWLHHWVHESKDLKQFKEHGIQENNWMQPCKNSIPNVQDAEVQSQPTSM